MSNLKTERRLTIMNATRANTVITTDGGVFGSTTETPPEDPPSPVNSDSLPSQLQC